MDDRILQIHEFGTKTHVRSDLSNWDWKCMTMCCSHFTVEMMLSCRRTALVHRCMYGFVRARCHVSLITDRLPAKAYRMAAYAVAHVLEQVSPCRPNSAGQNCLKYWSKKIAPRILFWQVNTSLKQKNGVSVVSWSPALLLTPARSKESLSGILSYQISVIFQTLY